MYACIHNNINFCICEHSRVGHMHGLYVCQYLKCLCSVYDPCLTAVVQCFKCGDATKICGGLVSFPDLIRCVYRFQYNTCNTESESVLGLVLGLGPRLPADVLAQL